jgi:uncharacterized protein YdaU (DUF1376 family)
MSSKPWFRWFSADYRAKTAHLDFIHDAAYRRLLDAYYEHRGPLPADPQALYRITGAQTIEERKAICEVAEEFFSNGDGKLTNLRADEELAECETYHRRMIEAGSKGGLSSAQARLKLGSSKAAAKLKQRSTHSHPQSHLHPHLQPQDISIDQTIPPGDSGVGVQGKGDRRAFRAPTVQEVETYVKSKSYPVDPERFVDHYTANGWRVGKNPMKDWQAAVRTWAKTSTSSHAKPQATSWWQSEQETERIAKQLGMAARPGESWTQFRFRINERLKEANHG